MRGLDLTRTQLYVEKDWGRRGDRESCWDVVPGVTEQV